MINEFYQSYIEELITNLKSINFDDLQRVFEMLRTAVEKNQAVYIFGNGGSAVTASHFACDLGKGTITDFKNGKRFHVVSLTDNVAWFTAIANDISYDDIFVEQLKNYLIKDDLVIGISASGNSPNVLKAIEYANGQGAQTIGLVGFGGGKLKELAHDSLVVPSRNYGVAEDFHLIIEHILTQYLKKELAE
ncbi:MAG: SIS domain-containing protein [Calditrichaceae bacterium]